MMVEKERWSNLSERREEFLSYGSWSENSMPICEVIPHGIPILSGAQCLAIASSRPHLGRQG